MKRLRYWRYRLVLRGARRRQPPPSREQLLVGREQFEAIGAGFSTPPDVTCTSTTLGRVPAETMRHAAYSTDDAVAGRPSFFYVHGGAYAMGSVAASKPNVVILMQASGLDAVSVEYRLAPEHPFPAGRDDVVDAWEAWVADNDPSRTVVVGESAGGGLVVSAMLEVRDRGLPLPAGLVLVSPWTDLTCESPTMQSRAKRDLALTPEMLRVAADAYLDGRDPRDPSASPLFAETFEGLPPTLTIVGTDEVLHNDSTSLHNRLNEDGVDARLLIGNAMLHCYLAYADMHPTAQEHLDETARWMRRVTGADESTGASLS